jgi:hypothetical protein
MFGLVNFWINRVLQNTGGGIGDCCVLSRDGPQLGAGNNVKKCKVY